MPTVTYPTLPPRGNALDDKAIRSYLISLRNANIVGGTNTGTQGLGWFTGVSNGILEFRNVEAGSSGILVLTEDGINNTIEIDIDETEFNDAVDDRISLSSGGGNDAIKRSWMGF